MIQRKSEQLRRKSKHFEGWFNLLQEQSSIHTRKCTRSFSEVRAAFTGSWWWDERTQAEGYVGLDASVLSETAREKRSAFGRGGGGRLHR